MVGVHQIRILEKTVADTGRSRFVLGVYRFLLVFAGVFLLLAGFLQAMELSVDSRLYLFLALVSAYLIFALSLERFSALLLLSGVLLSFGYFFSQRELIQDGLFHLENAFIEKFNLFYEAELIEFVTYFPSEDSVTVMSSLIAVLLAFLLAVSVTHWQLRGFWYVGVLLFLGLGAWVNAFPETSFLLLLILHCFLVWLSGNVKELSARERVRLLCFALFFLSVVMGLCRLICSEPLYESALKESKTRLSLQSTLREMDVQKLMKEMGAKLDSIMSMGSSTDRFSAGMAGGELSRSTKGIRFTETTHLKVTLPKDSESVYLRGYIGVNYTGERWEALGAGQRSRYIANVVTTFGGSELYTGRLINAFFVYGEECGVSAIASDYLLEEKHAYMEISVVGANPDYYYAPYDTYSYTGALSEADNCLKPAGSTRYTVGYFYNNEGRPFYQALGDANLCDLTLVNEDFYKNYEVRLAMLGFIGDLQEELQRYNEEYRAYVEYTYLDIPSSCMGVQGILETTGTLAGDVEQVVRYLQDNYEYSLSPQPMESGEDYIQHFLFESKEGYCMHFASAATMLFRSLGIPARYVEGYVIRPTDIREGTEVYEAEVETLAEDGAVVKETVPFVEVDVPDSAAHAWVEIYVDNYGWYPVEVTAGYGTTFHFTALPTQTQTPTPTQTPAVSSGASVTPMPTEAAASPSGAVLSRIPTRLLSPTGTLAVSQPAGTTPTSVLTESGAAGDDESNGNVLGILWRLLAVLAAVGVFGGSALLCVGRWKRARRALLRSADGKEKTLAYYRELLRLLGLRGLTPQERESDAEFCLRAERELREQAEGNAADQLKQATEETVSLSEICRIAQKARFSQNEPEEAETVYVDRCYRRLRAQVRGEVKGFRTLWFRLTIV